MSSIQQLISSFGSTVAPSLNVSDVFNTNTYTGNGTSQTITNGINISGNGGLIWSKNRGNASYTHSLTDTVRGLTKNLSTAITDAQYTNTDRITSVNSTGFSIGSSSYVNANTDTYVGWTFRKAPNFFDVVTYTGTNSSQTIPHSLGVSPGIIIIKCTDVASNWFIWHRNTGGVEEAITGLSLNSTSASLYLSNQESTSTFTTSNIVDFQSNYPHVGGVTYVAYLFAHDPTGIIQCGNFNTDGSGNATINLGWEPQYLMLKAATTTSNWVVLDSTRGWGAVDYALFPNLTNAESTVTNYAAPWASTGFYAQTLAASQTYIYMAIKKP